MWTKAQAGERVGEDMSTHYIDDWDWKDYFLYYLSIVLVFPFVVIMRLIFGENK